ELASKQRERPRTDIDDLVRRRDLGAQQRFLDGGRHQTRGKRQVRRLEQKSLPLGRGPQRLDLAPGAAEDVEGVAQRPLRRVKVEAQIRRTQWGGQRRGGFLTAR